MQTKTEKYPDPPPPPPKTMHKTDFDQFLAESSDGTVRARIQTPCRQDWFGGGWWWWLGGLEVAGEGGPSALDHSHFEFNLKRNTYTSIWSSKLIQI